MLDPGLEGLAGGEELGWLRGDADAFRGAGDGDIVGQEREHGRELDGEVGDVESFSTGRQHGPRRVPT